jgi:hypothetical protein
VVIYYGRTYNSASIGATIVEVKCDRCGTPYCFELARVGSGAASAPYAIGSAGAAESAKDQARRDLGRRLAEESELVPCPKCLWINEDLVEGYRRGRFRAATKAAAGVALAGACLTFVIAWFASNGPVGFDRSTFAQVLAVGLGATIAIPGSILLLCRYLRVRIRPNQDHPLPPKIPAGTPPALVRNPTTGELEPAAPVSGTFEGTGRWKDFQIGRSTLPPTCCVCLAPADPRSAHRTPVAPPVELVVPLCRTCSRGWNLRKLAGASIGLVVSAVTIATLLSLKLDEILFWFAACSVGLLAPVIGAMIAGRLATPARVKVVDGPRGVVRVWFRNEGFPDKVPASEVA